MSYLSNICNLKYKWNPYENDEMKHFISVLMCVKFHSHQQLPGIVGSQAFSFSATFLETNKSRGWFLSF